jgi:hypothetical protein
MNVVVSLTFILVLMMSAYPVIVQAQTEAPQSFVLRGGPAAGTVTAATGASVFGLQANSAAFAQRAFGVQLGPVVRVDHVNFGKDVEAGASGEVKIAGVQATVRIGRHFGVDAEFTQAWGQIEGQSPYYHSDILSPGFGWSSALVAGGAIAPRVSLFGRVGLAGRSYSETVTPLSVDPEYVRERRLGGLLLGVDVPVALTDRLSVAPEFRFVHGLILSDYREFGVGVRVGWRFR